MSKKYIRSYSFEEMYNSLFRDWDKTSEDALLNIDLNEVNQGELAMRENGVKILMTALKGIKKMSSKGKNEDIGRAIDDSILTLEALIDEWKEASLNEGSTEDAKGTLDAIVGFINKRKSTGKGSAGDDVHAAILKMGKGFQDHFKKEGSFSPAQAKWIYNTSKALFHNK